jgi:hypothetical protein
MSLWPTTRPPHSCQSRCRSYSYGTNCWQPCSAGMHLLPFRRDQSHTASILQQSICCCDSCCCMPSLYNANSAHFSLKFSNLAGCCCWKYWRFSEANFLFRMLLCLSTGRPRPSGLSLSSLSLLFSLRHHCTLFAASGPVLARPGCTLFAA